MFPAPRPTRDGCVALEGELVGSLAGAVVGDDAGFDASFELPDAGASGFVGPDGASLAAPFELPALSDVEGFSRSASAAFE